MFTARILPLLALSGVLLSAGCNNLMEPPPPEVVTQYLPNPDLPLFSVTPSDDVPSDAAVTFTVREHLDRVRTETSYIKYTPYNGWLELYEVPTGLVCFPVVVVSHVFSAVTFNIFPFTWSKSFADFSFACMNPALNTEWDYRAVVEEGGTVTTVLESASPSYTIPGAGVVLTLQSENRTWTVTTDANGQAEFAFLAIDSVRPVLTGADREIKVYVPGTPEPAAKLVISRELLRRLDQGFEALMQYHMEPTGANLAKCIDRLEELKFLKLAYQLETREKEANRDNPAFLREFEGR